MRSARGDEPDADTELENIVNARDSSIRDASDAAFSASLRGEALEGNEPDADKELEGKSENRSLRSQLINEEALNETSEEEDLKEIANASDAALVKAILESNKLRGVKSCYEK